MAGDRKSSTKGKHIQHTNVLKKGLACASCKARKVRCDGCTPACSSCQRRARYMGLDPEDVVCVFPGRGGRRRKGEAADDQATQQQMQELERAVRANLLVLKEMQSSSSCFTPTMLGRVISLPRSSSVSSSTTESTSSPETSSSEPESPEAATPALRDSPLPQVPTLDLPSFEFDYNAVSGHTPSLDSGPLLWPPTQSAPDLAGVWAGMLSPKTDLLSPPPLMYDVGPTTPLTARVMEHYLAMPGHGAPALHPTPGGFA